MGAKSRAKRERKQQPVAQVDVEPAASSPSRSRWMPIIGFALGILVTIAVISWRSHSVDADYAEVTSALPASFLELPDISNTSSEPFHTTEIALMNLLVAKGLPGTEDLEIESILHQLDRWANHVKRETDRHLYRFHQNPAEYENSEAYFRTLMMIVVLQDDLGVQYNPERIDEPDFTNPQDLFIHGMVNSDNGGTCVSMPALYVAIGRRLGYPMHLVVTKGHVFARWEDDHDRFNIEGTNRGLSTPDDEHYTNWPYRLSLSEKANGWYLKSLTPREELAVFLTQRGHVLEDTGRLDEAQVEYALANRLAPRSEAIAHLAQAVYRNGQQRANRDGPSPSELRLAQQRREFDRQVQQHIHGRDPFARGTDPTSPHRPQFVTPPTPQHGTPLTPDRPPGDPVWD